ncbi:hypothetical protein T492DRAFT_933683 [Pavlovales sp. CCMP2436]|nr:hypothetical protein T492DRAFT_933683 [Pavlovales sp. CCMP2436]
MQKWGRSRCRSGAVEMRRRTGALIKHWGCSERAENGLNSRSRTQGPRLISKQRSAAVVATAAMPPKRKKPTAQAEGAAVEGGDAHKNQAEGTAVEGGDARKNQAEGTAVEGGDAPPPGGRNQERKRLLADSDGLPGAAAPAGMSGSAAAGGDSAAPVNLDAGSSEEDVLSRVFIKKARAATAATRAAAAKPTRGSKGTAAPVARKPRLGSIGTATPAAASGSREQSSQLPQPQVSGFQFQPPSQLQQPQVTVFPFQSTSQLRQPQVTGFQEGFQSPFPLSPAWNAMFDHAGQQFSGGGVPSPSRGSVDSPTLARRMKCSSPGGRPRKLRSLARVASRGRRPCPSRSAHGAPPPTRPSSRR